MGAGDDRLNIDVPVVTKVMVDGGTGVNTIAVAESHGTDAENTFVGFANFQNFEVEGRNDTVQDFTSMAGITNVKVMTWDGADTTLIDLPVPVVTISGQNQTLDYRSNHDQEFGSIEILGADTATLDVKLENTARLDGELYVDYLNIDAESPANLSAVRTLNLESAGARNTTNVVDWIDAPKVNTFNLTGTQDLTVGMLYSAANSTAASAARESLVVDASTLTGDLDLTVFSTLISAVDAGDTSKVTLTGTAGAADMLTIDGAGMEEGIFTTADTTISGFETVAFNDTFGEFDATNVSGVNLFDIVNTDDDFAMINMSGIDTVQINAEESWSIDGGLTFAAKGQSTANVLTLEFRDANGYYDGTDFTPGWDALQVQDYRALTLDLGGNAVQDDDYQFELTFLDENGNDEWEGAFDPTTVYTRTLDVVGGGDQGTAGSDGGVDTVDLGNLTNVLSMIDTSGYTGQVTLTLDMYDSAVLDRNTTIEVNGYGLDATETQAGTDSNIVSYVFTTDAVKDTEIWNITGFDAFNNGTTDLTNLSILDMRALNVNGLVDLNIVDVGGTDTIITSNEGLQFEILLVGVDATTLSNENFVFAV